MSSTPFSPYAASTTAVGIRSAPPIALLLILLIAIGYAFHDALRAMVLVWDTENYQHGYLIVPMALWLAWRNRREILAQPLKPSWLAAFPLAGACAVWLIGRLADVNVVQQFAVVGMLPCALALVFGWRFTWSLAYPLAFLLFAVPFGEEFYPVMMQYTADFTVWAVRLSGVPVVQEGTYFQLPSGRWSVVEACSGLRYLLAALPLAALYAFISWRSWRVRALFIAMTAVVAVVANWVRAYLIVMLGHLSGMRLAVGIDHLIYGWIFFGIVMAGIFWLGSFWPDRDHAPGADRPETGRAGHQSDNARTSALGAGLVVALVIIAAAAAGAGRLQDQGTASIRLDAFDAEVDRTDTGAPVYRPVYQGGIERIEGTVTRYPNVHFLAVHYLHQDDHGEMITYTNGVNPGRADGGQHWHVASKTTLSAKDGAAYARAEFPDGPVNEYQIKGPGGLFLVREWFWINGRVETDHGRIKLATAADLLRGRGDESLVFVVWTPLDETLQTSRRRLDEAQARLQAGARAAGL